MVRARIRVQVRNHDDVGVVRFGIVTLEARVLARHRRQHPPAAAALGLEPDQLDRNSILAARDRIEHEIDEHPDGDSQEAEAVKAHVPIIAISKLFFLHKKLSSKKNKLFLILFSLYSFL